MQINLISGKNIDESLRRDWIRLQRSNPSLTSPYFCPDFSECVAAARDDVEIAIIKEHGQTVCIFPFQREQPSEAAPVGCPLSDYHGLICSTSFEAKPLSIIKACSLRKWSYNHLPTAQSVFNRYHQRLAASPVMDLSQGFARYVQTLEKRGSEYSNLLRKMRKLSREVGPLLFWHHVPEKQIFEKLIAWKSAQYIETGAENRFAIPWFRQTVENVFLRHSSNLSGVLSVLCAGNIPLAIHFGMRSSTVWHYWFPAYDPRYAKYSPGLILLLQMAERAPELGLATIDLGKGSSVRYKEALKSYDIPLAIGCVEVPSVDYYWRCFKRLLRRSLNIS